MTDLTALAASLSEAQRSEILSQTRSHYRYPTMKWGTCGYQLRMEGILEFHPDPRKSTIRLTPLGLALRDHIIKENGDDAD